MLLNNFFKMATLLILHNANPKEELVLSYSKYNMTTKNYSPLYLAIKYGLSAP